MALIGMDVDLGDSLSSNFNSQAGQVNGLFSSLQSQVNSMLDSWEGTNKASFVGEWEAWSNELKQLTADMEQLATRLKTTVGAFRDADKF